VKSRIYTALTEYSKDVDCKLYRVDVDQDGFFTNPGPLVAEHGREKEAWYKLINDKASVIGA
jgi:hypothetical protein